MNPLSGNLSPRSGNVRRIGCNGCNRVVFLSLTAVHAVVDKCGEKCVFRCGCGVFRVEKEFITWG